MLGVGWGGSGVCVHVCACVCASDPLVTYVLLNIASHINSCQQLNTSTSTNSGQCIMLAHPQLQQ